MTTLAAEHLAKIYSGRKVVSDVSLSVSTGEVVGLLGPNGAGKTTSFYMIVGLVTADDGKIRIDNNDITRTPMHERARMGVGYLPQEASIFRKLSVEDNIMAILELNDQLSTRRKNAVSTRGVPYNPHSKKSRNGALRGRKKACRNCSSSRQ